MEKEMIGIINPQGGTEEVELITYLISDDKLKQYAVYTKGEVRGDNNEQVIYISRLFKGEDNSFKLEEIVENEEWLEVQRLLKKIANANMSIS